MYVNNLTWPTPNAVHYFSWPTLFNVLKNSNPPPIFHSPPPPVLYDQSLCCNICWEPMSTVCAFKSINCDRAFVSVCLALKSWWPMQYSLPFTKKFSMGCYLNVFLVSLLHKTRVAMRFLAKNTSSCPWCRRASGWTKGRTVTWLKLTTKISRMHG